MYVLVHNLHMIWFIYYIFPFEIDHARSRKKVFSLRVLSKKIMF